MHWARPVSQTDAKSQTTTFEFDPLGRLKTAARKRKASAHGPGGLRAPPRTSAGWRRSSGPGYSESYTYDRGWPVGDARPFRRTDLPDRLLVQLHRSARSLTYPDQHRRLPPQAVNTNIRTAISHRIKDFNAPSTVFWTANAVNARNQITQETLGNGLVTNRALRCGHRVAEDHSDRRRRRHGHAEPRLRHGIWSAISPTRKDVNQSNLTELLLRQPLSARLPHSATAFRTWTWPTTRSAISRASPMWALTPIDATQEAPGGVDQRPRLELRLRQQRQHDQRPRRDDDWTSYNYPSHPPERLYGHELDYSVFSYTPDRQYWKQVSNYTSGGAATTIYVGGLLEKVTTSAGHGLPAHDPRRRLDHHRVAAELGTNTINYVTSDHLGSSSAITNRTGGILVNSSFDAFGSAGVELDRESERGRLDGDRGHDAARVHRAHDARQPEPHPHEWAGVRSVLGRFASADPLHHRAPQSQNYNRYSYVYNNPLSFTDPSGFWSDNCFGCDVWHYVSVEGWFAGWGTWHEGLMTTAADRHNREHEDACRTNFDQCVPVPVDPSTLPPKDNPSRWQAIAYDLCLHCGWPGDGSFDGFMSSFGPGGGVIAAPIRAARGGLAAVRTGQAGEAAVRAAANIGPKTAIDVAGRTRIPDGLLPGILSEVKNITLLSYTQQLRDLTQFSLDKGLRFDLYVRPGAQLSGPLLDARAQGLINILEIPFP